MEGQNQHRKREHRKAAHGSLDLGELASLSIVEDDHTEEGWCYWCSQPKLMSQLSCFSCHRVQEQLFSLDFDLPQYVYISKYQDNLMV